MQNDPFVSVVIPTHNRKKSVERLIRSIVKSTYKNWEIIIIDDASNDGTYNHLRSKFRNRKILVFKNKRNLFTGGTRNVGQKKSKGKYILFIDDDNVVDKNMIQEMVKTFYADPYIGEVGPVNYSFNKKNKIFWTRTARNMWTTKTYHVTKIPRSKKFWETPDVPNAFMVRADVVKKNKIQFNPNYGIMYEESDYAYRIRKLGYKIVVSKSAKIYHDIEEYSKKRKTKDYMYHFMNDPRRPYVFARNRVVFHKHYSNVLQILMILGFCIWFFNAYYVYKILFYKGSGNFSFLKRLLASYAYTKGTIAGLFFSF